MDASAAVQISTSRRRHRSSCDLICATGVTATTALEDSLMSAVFRRRTVLSASCVNSKQLHRYTTQGPVLTLTLLGRGGREALQAANWFALWQLTQTSPTAPTCCLRVSTGLTRLWFSRMQQNLTPRRAAVTEPGRVCLNATVGLEACWWGTCDLGPTES